MNNEALEKFCNKVISEIEILKLASINGKRGGDYRIALTHAIQTINGNLFEAREGKPDSDTSGGLHLADVNGCALGKKPTRYRCLLCGRDKFTRKSPHNCKGGFRKRNIQWQPIFD